MSKLDRYFSSKVLFYGVLFANYTTLNCYYINLIRENLAPRLLKEVGELDINTPYFLRQVSNARPF